MQGILEQFPASNFSLLGVVLALPLLGALVNGVFGKRLGKEAVRLMALTALGGSFVASAATFLGLLAAPGGRVTWTAYNWLKVQGRMQQTIPVDVGFAVDGMTAVMMLVVTGVGFLIHLYSSEYMKEDPGYYRFFAYLNLFCFAMLVLIMADNIVLLFVGWEGVGLCSYLLIGFWFSEEANASAGKKAFVANRIGDFGLLVAMAMLIYYTGSVSWEGIDGNAGALLRQVQVWPLGNMSEQNVPGWVARFLIPEKPVTVYASTLVALCLFLGAAGKSAQIPLYVWLPDAMAGPTPVSALIHAATMVTAGVYLVARMSSVFLLSPAAMAVVAVTGVLTALLAASIGLFQNDLKKVLAYSTVSQLGFMFIGVGVGAFSAGFFHVFTHAFFKACLFLGAGSVIHAMHARIHDTNASQDMRNMGGLARYMPQTRWTFLISCLAIAGAPLMSGFWSKDEILWSAFSLRIIPPETRDIWSWPSWLGPAIYVGGIVAATMTAFYMFRAYFTTFHGRFRGWTIVPGWKDPHPHGHGHDDHGHDEEHAPARKVDGPVPHESPLAMTAPLMVLAFFAIFGGFLYAVPLYHTFHARGFALMGALLDPVFTTAASRVVVRSPEVEALMWPMMLPGFGAFLVGTGAAMYVYLNKGGAPEQRFQASFPRLHGLIYDKWRIDELYDATVIGMVDALADIFTVADRWLVDGILAKLTAAVVAASGTILRAFHTGRVQVYSAAMVLGLASVGVFFVWPHAELTLDEKELRTTGRITVSAAPGLGYTYRWEAPGVPTEDFGPRRDIPVELSPGQTKEVRLQVRNAFRWEAAETLKITRTSEGTVRTAAAEGAR